MQSDGRYKEASGWCVFVRVCVCEPVSVSASVCVSVCVIGRVIVRVMGRVMVCVLVCNACCACGGPWVCMRASVLARHPLLER